MKESTNTPIRLYYFTSWEFGIKAIKNKKIKISTFDTSNDPNELRSIQTHPIKSPVFLNMRNDKFIAKVGIICFTPRWYNPLMWGHYSDNHNGICLGFDITTTEKELLKVKYIDEIEFVNVIDDDLFKEIMSTKSKQWEYEKEQRMGITLDIDRWDEEKNMYFQNFKGVDYNLNLKEVLIGLRRDAKDLFYIERLLNKHKYQDQIEITKVNISESSFDFEKDKNSKINFISSEIIEKSLSKLLNKQ